AQELRRLEHGIVRARGAGDRGGVLCARGPLLGGRGAGVVRRSPACHGSTGGRRRRLIPNPSPEVLLMTTNAPPKLLVIGNGMVGHHFVTTAIERGLTDRFAPTVIGEEGRPAYDRVHLSSYFEDGSADALALATPEAYERAGVQLLLGDPAVSLDRAARRVTTRSGQSFGYDKL